MMLEELVFFDMLSFAEVFLLRKAQKKDVVASRMRDREA